MSKSHDAIYLSHDKDSAMTKGWLYPFLSQVQCEKKHSWGDDDWADSLVQSIWRPVMLGLCVGAPAAFIIYRYVIGKRYPTVGHIPPEVFTKRTVIRGKVTSVGDSDNFRIYHTPGIGWGWLRRVPTGRKELKDQTLPIRIAGVDAPEGAHFGMPSQPYYAESKAHLTSMVLNRYVKVEILSRDQYSRIVAMAYIRKPPFYWRKNVSEEMLKAGCASMYVAKGAQYAGQLKKLEKAEARARLLKKGIWSLKDYVSPGDHKAKTLVMKKDHFATETSAISRTTITERSTSFYLTTTENVNSFRKVAIIQRVWVCVKGDLKPHFEGPRTFITTNKVNMLYLTADFFPIFVPLGVIGFYRYLIFLVKLCGWFAYQPIRPIANPLYRANQDVTIVVPTIDAGEEFCEAARSWLACDPKEIIVVTEECMMEPMVTLARSIDAERIRVLSVPRASKRLQMVEGVIHTKTDILVFADDDAIWPPTMLDYMLACFEDESVGGVGTSQTVKSLGRHQSIWEILAGFRLSVRNIEVAASTHIDGGVCCISGRTGAYRTVILKDPAFQDSFINDYWCGKYQLNSGDDKFLTRWMVSHGWTTYMQVCKEVLLLSTFKDNWRFLKQVLRWTRNTWRSDFRSLFVERHIWHRHPFVAYTMIDKCLNPFSLLSGPISVLVLCNLDYHLPNWNIVTSYVVWLLLTRCVKLLPHLAKRPQDIWALPGFLVFNFYFSIMKLYALVTLHETGWGTRKEAVVEEKHY